MANRTIRNDTAAIIYLSDFGNQMLAVKDALGDRVILVDEEHIIVNSDQLFTLVSDGNVVVLDDNSNDIKNVSKAWKHLISEPDRLPISEVGNKVWVHPSSKPQQDGKSFYTVWAGAGDDAANHVIGGGEKLEVYGVVDNPTTVKDFKFDHSLGQIFVHEAYMMWIDAADGDYISGSVIAEATALQQSVDLDYEMDGNRVKYASGGAGAGTHGLAATPTLVPNRDDLGHWNYDETNGLTPNLTETGLYDIYDVEVEVHRFINNIPLHGTSPTYFEMDSEDSAELPAGYFLRVELTNGSNTTWHVHLIVSLYRERTV